MIVVVLGCWKVLKCLYFCWVWLHSLCGEDGSIKGYLGLSDGTLATVKKMRPFQDTVSISYNRCLSCSSVVLPYMQIC